MKKLFSFRKQGEKGFTLIELLVVIAILGILAAVAIPNLVGFIGKGKIGAANAELGLVRTAVTAAMAGAGTDSVTGAPATLKAGSDINPPVDGYIQGGVASLQGTYTVAADGTITAASYPGVTDATVVNGVLTFG